MPIQDKTYVSETKSAPEDRAKAKRIRREIEETRSRAAAVSKPSPTERAAQTSNGK